ncbi:MAG TPA: hypothetical protein DCR97_12455 [Deltaproteobacteria bacterium]|nr:hypothetical protein [Deltaproteobacteria bacterium]
MRKLIVPFIVLSLTSCSYIPFMGKKDSTVQQKKSEPVKAVQKVEKIDESEPKPGDIKVIDGVEYIYARNRRYMLTPYEPEYVWIRKDEYSPGMFEALAKNLSGNEKERKQLEERIAKLEEDLKKKGIAPQIAYPAQIGMVPTGVGYPPAYTVPFAFPSPKMRRRIVILLLEDRTNYKEEHFGELATRRLITRVENSGAILCIDPNTIRHTGALTDPQNMKILNELYGIQAVVKGAVSDTYVSTARADGKDDTETSFALSKIALTVYNTETGTVLRQLSGRNPVFLSREKGDMSPEKAKVKAIDLAVELLAEDLLKSILNLDWHARVASVETGRVYINAGRLSGLQKGDILEVYAPGREVVDPATNSPMGKTKGIFKGEVEVSELFGLDACWATPVKAASFSATDLVYLKK